MLAPDSQPDQARGDAPEEGDCLEEAQRQRHFVEHGLADHERGQNAIVESLLRSLDHTGRKHPALLHLLQQRIDLLAARKRCSEDVCCCDRVLDREVDADASDR